MPEEENGEDRVIRHVREWMRRETKRMQGIPFCTDGAQLILTLQEAGWDEHDNDLIDVQIEERALVTDISVVFPKETIG